MNRKKRMIVIVLLCLLLLSGCFNYEGYPKYKVKEDTNQQYYLISPDGVKYVTLEEPVWYPKEIIWGPEFSAVIGKCKLGYIFETSSKWSICTYDFSIEEPKYFFHESENMPELIIENVHNAYLLHLPDRSELEIETQTTEKLIELYHYSDAYETKNKQSMKDAFILVFECEQLREHYFSVTIYNYEKDFYMYISDVNDSDVDETKYILIKCTSVIEEVLNDN